MVLKITLGSPSSERNNIRVSDSNSNCSTDVLGMNNMTEKNKKIKKSTNKKIKKPKTRKTIEEIEYEQQLIKLNDILFTDEGHFILSQYSKLATEKSSDKLMEKINIALDDHKVCDVVSTLSFIILQAITNTFDVESFEKDISEHNKELDESNYMYS